MSFIDIQKPDFLAKYDLTYLIIRLINNSLYVDKENKSASVTIYFSSTGPPKWHFIVDSDANCIP